LGAVLLVVVVAAAVVDDEMEANGIISLPSIVAELIVSPLASLSSVFVFSYCRMKIEGARCISQSISGRKNKSQK
jgi:hypothetical protein